LICSQHSGQRNNKKFSTTVKGALIMSKRMTKHTLDEGTQAVLSVRRDKKPVKTIAREHDVNKTTIQVWGRKYEG